MMNLKTINPPNLDGWIFEIFLPHYQYSQHVMEGLDRDFILHCLRHGTLSDKLMVLHQIAVRVENEKRPV